MKLSFLSLCLSSVILLASCTKENVTAPSGNQNPVNSSSEIHVSASGWMSSSSLTWSAATTASDNSLQTSFSANVPEEVINNNALLIYAKDNADGSVKPFPATFSISDADFDSYSSIVEPYSIQLTYSSYRGGVSSTPTLNDAISFRYIALENAPPSDSRIETGSAAGYTIDEIRRMDYNDVLSLFSIHEQ